MSRLHGMKTNLAEVKRLAKVLLNMEPELTEFSPMIVHHPFTNSGVVGLLDEKGNLRIGNIVESREDRKQWQNQVEKIIDGSDNVLSLYHLIEKPYVLGFLKFAAPNLSKADFSTILADAWIRSEQPNHDPNLPQNKLLAMFKAADPLVLMDDQERGMLDSLGDTVMMFIQKNQTEYVPCPGLWTWIRQPGSQGGTVGRDVCTRRKLKKPISARCSWGEMNPR